MFIAALFVITEHWKKPRCPSMGEWLHKLVHSYYAILLCNIKAQANDTCHNMDNSPGNYAECKKPILQMYRVFDSIYITFLKGQNRRNEEPISCCQDYRMGWRRGGRREVDVVIKRQHYRGSFGD